MNFLLAIQLIVVASCGYHLHKAIIQEQPVMSAVLSGVMVLNALNILHGA